MGSNCLLEGGLELVTPLPCSPLVLGYRVCYHIRVVLRTEHRPLCMLSKHSTQRAFFSFSSFSPSCFLPALLEPRHGAALPSSQGPGGGSAHLSFLH